MGIVRWGPPEDLLVALRQRLGIDTFVETGTFEGRTAQWAAGVFRNVKTVELSERMFASTALRLSRFDNVEAAQGHSADFLREIVAELERPAIFWLDAHWCGGGAPTSGAPDSVCPVLAEVAEINRSPLDHVILVDDARYFLEPPEPPYDPAAWPGIADVLAALHAPGKQRYSVVKDDVIVCVPAVARDVVVQYCRNNPTPKPTAAR